MGHLALGITTIFVAVVALAEFATWRMSRRPPKARPASHCAVIVLGYPTARSGRLHPVQRWRTEIGVRTLEDLDDGWLIFSGGPTRGSEESEAAVMARYAVTVLGVPENRVQIECKARSTWDNVRLSIPLAESARQVVIASDPFHAEKARCYVAHQRPELTGRIVRASDYRVLERWWLKVLTLANYVRLRASGNFGSRPPELVHDES